MTEPSGSGTIRQDGKRIFLKDIRLGLTVSHFPMMVVSLLQSPATGTVRIWRCDAWETVAVLDEPTSSYDSFSVAFHPDSHVLATLGENDMAIRVWNLDIFAFLGTTPLLDTIHYTNTKVVLVGDTGMGKTGLGIVLTGQPFRLTESTHGRHVWIFDSREFELGDGRKETREILLWDLAGQPGYRLIHQLHLNEVAVALVVFDARSETEPFAGVRHWIRALRQAQYIQGDSAPPIKKFLVAARIDRGGISVSQARINSLVRDLDFDGYFETSAKEGWGITGLAQAIRQSVDWEMLPKVSSTILFDRIKSFLIAEKEAERLLSTADDLYRAFKSKEAFLETEDLWPQFETCINLIESRDLIRRLSFGGLILLQPELLDAYASAMVNAARQDPDGIGSIAEEDLRVGRFRIPTDERIADRGKEELLRIATIEDLIRHEIALREQSDHGPYLVFPSQFTREHPDLPEPEGKEVIFNFEGAVLDIYTTLAVRLSNGEIFKMEEMWKNAAVYAALMGGTCGMFLREIEEGHGELTLFFDPSASKETRFQFEEYVYTHLRRRASSIHRRRIFACPECDEPITDRQVRRRRERGHTTINCPVCEAEISLLDREEQRIAIGPSRVPGIDRAADKQRELEMAASILQGKTATRDFDIFLCHNSEDKPVVKEIGEQLKKRGILPWLDEWELRPGVLWQEVLEKQIKNIKSVAVFIGRNGTGPWQDREMLGFLLESVERKCLVIPVILRDCVKDPELPTFFKGMTWVDFRKEDPDPLERLIWGITGERSRSDEGAIFYFNLSDLYPGQGNVE